MLLIHASNLFSFFFFFFLMIRRPPRSTRTDTLFPYTALFRSFGSAYANDFNREGRILRVLLQAEASHRMTPQDVLDLKVRNAAGEMVPFGSFTQVEWTSGAQQLQRYNGYPSMTISAKAAQRQSTGEALADMERPAHALPE